MGQYISNGVYIQTDRNTMTYRSSFDKTDSRIAVNDIRLENLMKSAKGSHLLLKYDNDNWQIVYS